VQRLFESGQIKLPASYRPGRPSREADPALDPERRPERVPERRGEWLHVAADALGSVGATAASGLVWAFGSNWAGPAASVLIAVLVLYSSWGLLKETVSVLMEGAPGAIDVDEVRESVVALSGVRAVHDLHVWTITSGMVAMSGRVVVDEDCWSEETLREVRRLLHDRFGIDHSTVQT
jgi:cobalt-zinc-cadmium efflux system protein